MAKATNNTALDVISMLCDARLGAIAGSLALQLTDSDPTSAARSVGGDNREKLPEMYAGLFALIDDDAGVSMDGVVLMLEMIRAACCAAHSRRRYSARS